MARGSGSSHWWHQRLTALALVPFVMFLVALLPVMAGASRGEFRDLVQIPVVALALILLLVIGIYHMKLGLQAVIDDYVGDGPVGASLQKGLVIGCLVMAVAGIASVLVLAVF